MLLGNPDGKLTVGRDRGRLTGRLGRLKDKLGKLFVGNDSESPTDRLGRPVGSVSGSETPDKRVLMPRRSDKTESTGRLADSAGRGVVIPRRSDRTD